MLTAPIEWLSTIEFNSDTVITHPCNVTVSVVYCYHSSLIINTNIIMKSKLKIILTLLTALLASAGLFSVTSAHGLAQEIGTGAIRANANVNVEVQAEGNTTSATAQTTVRGNATSSGAQTAERGNATSTAATSASRGNATSTEAKADGQLTAESHRSTIATFVQTLLGVANREGGIGTQVRAVAMAQQDSASTSVNAIAKVEAKSGIRAFFFGSDYKSLGQLRSEMVITQNNIDQLKTLLSQAVSDTDKGELSAQIQVLEDSQTKIDAFVQAHESSFSVFGWFTRLFQ